MNRITLAALFLLLTASSAQAEPPSAQLRPIAPGAIAIDWQHAYDGAAPIIIIQREDPAFTWVFGEMSSTFVDLGLQPSHTYRYLVCAKYLGPTAEILDCTSWLATQTPATPPPNTPTPREVPSFTSSSATTSSITVNWASSQTYSFYQVRWAENGHGDDQNKINGRSFTASGLRPGVYHFIVQGCTRGLFGSNCSRFSSPIEVATYVAPPPPPPPPPPAKGVIYGITLNDDLMWYRHDGRIDGSFKWASNEGKQVGTGWNFKQVFSGGDGIIYAVDPMVDARVHVTGGTTPASGGNLWWYRHVGREDGSFRWEGPKKVGTGWNFKQVFSGGDGVIYAVDPMVEARVHVTGGTTPASGGNLWWYRHVGREDGSFRWEGPKKVGTGWNVKQVFSGGDGIIYATMDNGDLMWFRHDGRNDGSFTWASNQGKKVGVGWFNFSIKQIVAD